MKSIIFLRSVYVMMVNCAAVAGCFLSYSTLLVYYILRNGATALLAIPKENHNKKPILLQKTFFS